MGYAALQQPSHLCCCYVASHCIHYPSLHSFWGQTSRAFLCRVPCAICFVLFRLTEIGSRHLSGLPTPLGGAWSGWWLSSRYFDLADGSVSACIITKSTMTNRNMGSETLLGLCRTTTTTTAVALHVGRIWKVPPCRCLRSLLCQARR